jgi:hypothetical protein
MTLLKVHWRATDARTDVAPHAIDARVIEHVGHFRITPVVQIGQVRVLFVNEVAAGSQGLAMAARDDRAPPAQGAQVATEQPMVLTAGHHDPLPGHPLHGTAGDQAVPAITRMQAIDFRSAIAHLLPLLPPPRHTSEG